MTINEAIELVREGHWRRVGRLGATLPFCAQLAARALNYRTSPQAGKMHYHTADTIYAGTMDIVNPTRGLIPELYKRNKRNILCRSEKLIRNS